MASASGIFMNRYKEKSLCFGINEGKRIIRADKMNADRKDRRRNAFSIQRDLKSPLTDSASNKRNPHEKQAGRHVSRLEALRQWKKDKEARQRLVKNAGKPVFKVGVVKHKVYSPPCCCNKENCRAQVCMQTKLKGRKGDQLASCVTPSVSAKPSNLSASSKKRTPAVPSAVMSTRAKFLQRRNVQNISKPPVTPAAQSLETPVAADVKVFVGSLVEERSCAAQCDVNSSDVVPEEKPEPSSTISDEVPVSVVEAITQATPPPAQAPEPSIPVEAHKPEQGSGDTGSDTEDYPAMHSPYITVTRGKHRSDAFRKGFDSPRIFSSIPTTSLQSLSDLLSEMHGHEHERGVNYFRLKLKLELGLLDCMCNYWSATGSLCKDEGKDWHGLIHSAVGQCKLLMTRKMKQFASLIDDCESQAGQRTVTVDDLQGFWDVMNMQVVDVRRRFCVLEEQYLSAGQVQDNSKRSNKRTSRGRKAAANTKPKVQVKSSMRAMIAAARQKQKAGSEDVLELQPAPLGSAGRTPRRSASLHRQTVLRESQRKTVTWDTTPNLHNTPSDNQQLLQDCVSEVGDAGTPPTMSTRRVTRSSVSTPKSALKKNCWSPEHAAPTTGSKYRRTPKKFQFAEDLMSLDTPVEEATRVRRSKRVGSMGVK